MGDAAAVRRLPCYSRMPVSDSFEDESRRLLQCPSLRRIGLAVSRPGVAERGLDFREMAFIAGFFKPDERI